MSETSGLALGAGFGTETAGLGFVAHYYLQVPDSRFRFALHAGTGTTFMFSESRWGGAGGVTASFGRRHRLLLDVYTSALGAQSLALHTRVEDVRILYGVGVSVGWEWIARSGVYVRSSIGPSFMFLPRIHRELGELGFSLQVLAVGYKIW